jgi:hypothetical protein
MEGLLYEPRALWSIANAVVNSDTRTPTTVKLNRRHFTNGTRWPMTFKRLVVSGVSYTLNQQLNPVGNTAFAPYYQQAADIVQQVAVTVSAPQRYHLTSKLAVNSAALTPRPRGEAPTPGYLLGSDTTPGITNIQNTCRLVCDYPLVIPITGAIEWQLSSYNAFVPVVGEQSAPDAPGVGVTMLYQEQGGMFFGDCRKHEYNARPYALPGGALLSPFFDAEEKWPYPPDLFSAAGAYGGNVTHDWWDPQANFSAGKFKKQNATRDGSTIITDLRTTICQYFGWDVPVQSALTAVGNYTPQPDPPRTRIRTSGVGSEAWWWRPGAPLALVFDAQTPALVYELPEEITLEPGDSLDVTMTLPALGLSFGEVEAFDVPFHIGVSLNGYSPIEG